MKTLAKKLLAVTFAAALFTGCASVTDAGLEAPQQDNTELTQDQPDEIGFGSEQTMEPIVDRPE